MLNYPYWTGIMFVLFMTACNEPTIDFSEYEERCIINSWMQNFKDGCGGGNMIFKPLEDQDFTKWNFRNRLTLLADGTANYTIASPDDPHKNDRPRSVTGMWSFDYDSDTLMILDSGGKIIYSFDVHNVGEGFLILSYRETTTDENAH